MKKILAFIIALLTVAGTVACGSDKTEESSVVSQAVSETESKETELSSAEESLPAVLSAEVSEESKETEMKVYNVVDYGAKADDDNDDSEAFQEAINAAAKHGGVVYIPEGTFRIAHTVKLKAGVSLKGANMWNTKLKWTGKADNAIIDTANEALWGTTIENIYFLCNMMDKIVGIRGGSTLKSYNSAIGSFKNLVFSGLYCGICGDAEPEGVGIFDCYFENIFCSNCTYGLHLYGSGNTIVHPRIATCTYGLTLDFLNGESFDGVHVIGGIFASNTTDIYLPSKNGTRPCDFVGTWFENASHGILEIANPSTRVMNMTFRDCMLNSSADGSNYYLFDARNALGVVTLDSCTVYENKGIKEPTDSAAVLAITNLQVYSSDGTYVISDNKSGCYSYKLKEGKTELKVVHGMKSAPKSVTVTPGNELAASVRYYITISDTYFTIHFVDSPKAGEVVFYWEANK